MTPRATMRLQFHKGFTFADAATLVPYFSSLGISHLYASPIMTARPGSLHGYDMIDPTRINPELGGEEEFQRLVAELRRHDMGIIVDIVPNHMAIGADNPWWMDVLTAGRTSRFAKYFDIDWKPVDLHLRGKVLLPVLGRPYGEALAAAEIRLESENGKAWVRYFDHVFPLADATSRAVAQASPKAYDPATPQGRERLHEILEDQYYRLAWWRLANDEINWRRFFDINDLVGLRVEIDEVFETVHATTLRLYAQGLIDGVRVDHIDGLAQPGPYCRKLRARLTNLEAERPPDAPKGPAYFVVEKILSRNEELRSQWQTDGTTGYDFMDEVDALAHDGAGEAPLTAAWRRISGRSANFDEEEELARRQILDRSFSAQRESTVLALYAILQSELALRDISWSALRRALTEILVHFPVYRIYTRIDQSLPPDLDFLSRAVRRAKQTCSPADAWLVDLLGAWLGGAPIRKNNDPLQNVALVKFQQLSAPLCAKAVEDTAFYRYGRLISRNDVGFDVRRFAASPAEFHDAMQRRAARLPHALLATATHDHKRGEDVRSRLAVLSEFADDWAAAVARWVDAAIAELAGRKSSVRPSPGDLAILFQTVVGAWPMNLSLEDPAALAAYGKRITAWQRKAVREAKLYSDWSAPNETYENALADFIRWLFCEPNGLLPELHRFVARIMAPGAVNGLAQMLLKLTVPGVPDIYQGTDYWDLSLVDPDNREPVDFALRQRSLTAASRDALVSQWRGGRIKQRLMADVFAVRKKMPSVFSSGAYLPLTATGPMADRIVAFARSDESGSTITVVCKRVAPALKDGSIAIPGSFWRHTCLVIPPQLQWPLADVLVPPRTVAPAGQIEVGALLDRLPVAFLVHDATAK
jgi:malto-oligosyltrehalose synthase